MSRQKILLLIVAFLAVLQFLVVPGFAYIDEQNETVSAKNNKSQKEQALLQLKEPIAEQLVQVEGSLAELRKFTFKTDSIESGSLEVQKIFEDIAKKYNVKVNRLNWLKPEEDAAEEHAIQIVIKGSPSDWVMLQSELEAKEWLVLKKMTFFYSRRSGDASLIGDVSGVLSYKVNFWVSSDGVS